MSFLEKAIKEQEEDFYLRKTSYLMHIQSTEFRAQLTGLYNHSDLKWKVVATILNAIATEGKPTFYLSRRYLENLIAEDSKNLSYKGRKGIKTTEYRQAYAELFNLIASNGDGFLLVEEPSREHKTPACIQLSDEKTLLSMGDQMMIKLASNWHQTAVKQLSNMRKCHEIAEQSKKSSPDNVNDNVKVNQTKTNMNDFNKFLHPLDHGQQAATNITPEAILATWKPTGKINYKELDNSMSDLFTTLKFYSFPKEEISTKKIIRAMFGPSPAKEINWLVLKAEQAAEEQREIIYSSGLQMQSGLTKTPARMVEDVEFNRFEFIMSKAKGAKNV